MLTVEEIKRCVEEFKPEGFRVEHNSGGFRLSYLDGSYFTLVKKDNDCRELLYPLFLQRVIEGINREYRFRLKQEDNMLDIYLVNSDGETYSIKQINGHAPDQAKEQAIKYILTK